MPALFYKGGNKLLINHKIEGGFRYSITHWFQPIYHLKHNNVVAYEALLRDASPSQIPPIDIFNEAKNHGCLNVLDLLSIKTAVETFGIRSAHLFLNIFPSTLLEEGFVSWWDANIPPLKTIVLELLENEPVRDWDKLKAITAELRVRGVKIAVDDMGMGYSFFQQWIELYPDFIKLDRYFSKDLSVSSQKQKVVKSLTDLLSGTTEIIIEGVETKADLDAAELLGIPYAQGYLLGKPSPNILRSNG